MLYTGRINGPAKGQVVDVTAKSAKGIWRSLAPTWTMVHGYKHGYITQKQYTVQYRALLKRRNSVVKKAIGQLVEMAQNNDVTLVCYCRPGDFCHRVLLAQWLEAKYPGIYGGEV